MAWRFRVFNRTLIFPRRLVYCPQIRSSWKPHETTRRVYDDHRSYAWTFYQAPSRSVLWFPLHPRAIYRRLMRMWLRSHWSRTRHFQTIHAQTYSRRIVLRKLCDLDFAPVYRRFGMEHMELRKCAEVTGGHYRKMLDGFSSALLQLVFLISLQSVMFDYNQW